MKFWLRPAPVSGYVGAVPGNFMMSASAGTAALGKRGTYLMCWLMVFFFLDTYTTSLGLSQGFIELNPVVASMVHLTGLQGLVLTKIAAVLMASYFLYTGRLALLRRVTVLMGLVVCWNVFWLASRSSAFMDLLR
jgi:hypothetical protein